MPRPNLNTPEGRSLLNTAIARQERRCRDLNCSDRRKCHTCGAGVHFLLDGEEWCSRCKSYQRPVPHGWSRWEAVSEIPQANA